MDNDRSLQEFTCFGRLPKELRWDIWELAIQNRYFEPQAHFFRADGRDGRRKDDKSPLEYPPKWCDEGQESHIGPPSWRPVGEGEVISWTDPENPSGYLRDTGLWNACGESRMIMARLFKRLAPKHAKEGHDITTQIVRDGQRCHWITVRPSTDLIIFQTPDAQTYLNDELYGAATWSFDSHCRNDMKIGFEYNRQWATEFGQLQTSACNGWNMLSHRQDTSLGRFLLQIGDMNQGAANWMSYDSVLYFVDYNLRPINGVPYADMDMVRKREVYSANGRHYIEVRWGDIGLFWEPVEGDAWEDTALGQFWNRLSDWLPEFLNNDPDWEEWYGLPDPPDIRVLGCVVDG